MSKQNLYDIPYNLGVQIYIYSDKNSFKIKKIMCYHKQHFTIDRQKALGLKSDPRATGTPV